MLASELIKELQNLIEKYGDSQVTSSLDYVITDVMMNDREGLEIYYSLEEESQSIEDYYYEQDDREWAIEQI